MSERTVTCLGFRYEDADGYIKLAQRGETVNLSDDEAARGDRLGAFTVEETAVVGETTISPASTDDELIAFVKDANVGKVVEAAGGDAEFAKRLLEAENGATGNDPRRGVAQGLAAVVGEV